jgi:hypothetical protein
MWRLVSARHPGSKRGPIIGRKLETIVVARRGTLGPIFRGNANYRQYAGVIIAVSPTGLTFSLVPPLNVMCSPFSVPFEQIELDRTDWALWPEPFALRLKNQPEIDIVLARDAVQWIRSLTDQKPFGWDV